jgi:hypothetical protein
LLIKETSPLKKATVNVIGGALLATTITRHLVV